MDPTSLAAGLIAAKTGQMQMAVAAKMMKMNADASKSVVQMLDAGQANLEKLNNLVAGVGGNLDVTA
jgi:hypothetical protein